MKEPSVLDFVKSRLLPWKYPPVEIPKEDILTSRPDVAAQDVSLEPAPPTAIEAGQSQEETAPEEPAEPVRWPWRSLLALALALAAQFSMRPGPDRGWQSGAFLLLVAISTFGWAFLRGEWQVETASEAEAGEKSTSGQLTLRIPDMLIGTMLAIFAFLAFGGLEFGLFNTGLLLAALFFIVRALWVREQKTAGVLAERLAKLRQVFKGPIQLHFSWSALLGIAGIAWVAFFRYFRLSSVPPEMNSDHAEKIMDVLRVLSGQTMIFFPSNGGREALQFYLVAGVHKYLGVPLGFDILKLVTITVGFLALPFIYLIGKEIANRRVGLLAFLFAGIAYWPNVVSRAAMRLPFYMLFTAATLYFLIRGIRRSRRNDFIWAGIALGLSLYGYSADRILPLVVLLALGLYLLHRQSHGRKQFTIIATLALVFLSLIVFLPLVRYILSEPDAFLFRTLTRMGNLERPLEQSPWLVFLDNLGRALAMFSWSNGNVWVISIPNYPALGIVAGALFYLGAVILFIRYVRQRNWLDLFWLLSIPALMLPSILSLAFPHENPNLYRTGGAIVPVFLMVAIALDRLMQALVDGLPKRTGPRLAWGLALLLFAVSSLQDYNLVFNSYYQQYKMSAWNTSEMGQVARDFIESIGSPDTVWVVGYAHWVDTRLVALNAGYPGRDFQIFVDQLESTLPEKRAKLFLLNPEDEAAVTALNSLYPSGWLQIYTSKVPTKDFMIFVVPPMSEASLAP